MSVKVDDIKVDDLCREPVAAKRGDPNDFMGSCIRIKGHPGRHQKINNGMTDDEVRAITEQDLDQT